MKKELLTKEKILLDYKKLHNPTTEIIITLSFSAFFIAIGIFIICVFHNAHNFVKIYGVIVMSLSFGTALCFIFALVESLKTYACFKNENYRITTDHVIGFISKEDFAENFMISHPINRLRFKQYGDYNIMTRLNGSPKFYRDGYDAVFEQTKTMDEFYVVLYKEKIILAYNKKIFTLIEDEIKTNTTEEQ